MREERNYDIYDKELVEILRSLEEWRALEEVCSYRRKISVADRRWSNQSRWVEIRLWPGG
jgi:hypothetical protein